MSYNYKRRTQQREAEEALFLPPETWDYPQVLNTSRKHAGVQLLSGVGNRRARVMFVAPKAEFEEMDPTAGRPAYLGSPSGAILSRILKKLQYPTDSWYYTTVLKMALPKGKKPYALLVNRAKQLLHREIEDVHPEIIVCMGKLAVNAVLEKNYAMNRILGGWFQPSGKDYRVYVMSDPWQLVKKPETYDRFFVDLNEVQKTMKAGRICIKEPPQNRVINNMHELDLLSQEIYDDVGKIDSHVCIDMEGGGQSPVDGTMRSLQVGWDHAEKSAYIRFYDDKLNYVFDGSQLEAGNVIRPWYEKENVRLVGHQVCTDLTWCHFKMGLNYFGRSGWDSLFAEHTVDENSDFKLERLSIKYTGYGRYDMPLVLWKQENKSLCRDGYMLVPDDILIPYGLRDICVPLEAIAPQMRVMVQEGTYQYFMGTCLPFVTDIFTDMMVTGLPINRQYLETLREDFHTVQMFLEDRLRKSIIAEARKLLVRRLQEVAGDVAGMVLASEFCSMLNLKNNKVPVEWLKDRLGQNWTKVHKHVEHMLEAPVFNIRSHGDLRRWLFDVKGYTPIKTTKSGGFSMAWEKVESLPKNKQVEYSPSVDKNVLKTFANQDDIVDEVLRLNAVGNITKGFLRPPDDEGNENGVLMWVSSDERIHGNFALTDTARTRTWNPNILNYNKFVSEYIDAGFRDYNQTIEPSMRVKATGVRSGIQAIQGYCLVDSDWATAEVVALAFLSGDMRMVNVMSQPDLNFAFDTNSLPGKDIVVRISYDHNDCPVSLSNRDPKFLKDPNTFPVRRDNLGRIIHPRRDVHWEVAEDAQGIPRERLNKDIHRAGAKVVNFCIAEDEPVLTRRGWVKIQNVLDCDTLWDGLEWVRHEGVEFSGIKEVHTYQGLSASDKHKVWTEEKGKITLGEARAQSLKLFCPSLPIEGSRGTRVRPVPGDRREMRERTFLPTDEVQGLRGGHSEQTSALPRTCRTYDIINAGPRNRFTCSGILVSNSVPYGATGGSVERQIEVVTGMKPEPGTGDELLAARAKRFPVAHAWLIDQEVKPMEPGFTRCISGRVRHFDCRHLGDIDSLSEYQRKSILSPLTRKARNFPIQSIVAATVARSQYLLKSCYLRLNMQSEVPVSQYDAIVSHAPYHERWACRRLHHLCMGEAVKWQTAGGTLQFDVDTDFTIIWGSKPDNEMSEYLNSRQDDAPELHERINTIEHEIKNFYESDFNTRRGWFRQPIHNQSTGFGFDQGVD